MNCQIILVMGMNKLLGYDSVISPPESYLLFDY